MTYTLKTRFNTKKFGLLNIEFEYCGCTVSVMRVEQKIIITGESRTINYEFCFNTDIFKKYTIEFLQEHIKTWDSTYAFNGEDIVLKFYNEVIAKTSEQICTFMQTN